ncbi:HEPN domain-containing protein [Amaricoccus tamworthensis]|uniref:HEPN domain-containing protein n=1 Tax=Amaricoccus tamworthensis TaxID=57002 RepID=UPI003C7B0C46
MTETSVEFAKLELALVEAGGLLADLPQHDVGNRLQQLKLKSYVLLCHAAIEEYLESVSLAVLNDSLVAFENDSVFRDPLLSACSYYKIVLSEEAPSRQAGDRCHDLFLILFKKARSEHVRALEGINGIKTKDQDAILRPIGVRLMEFDRILCQSLNSYGGVRGEIAHQFGVRTVVPRAGQERNVWNLFQLLRPLDNMLCERHHISFNLV